MGIQWEKIAYNWDIMVIFHGDTGYSGDNQQTSLVGLNGKICGKNIFNLGTYMGTPASNGDVNLNDRGKIMVIYIIYKYFMKQLVENFQPSKIVIYWRFDNYL